MASSLNNDEKRIELQRKLEGLYYPGETPHVYFQPPASVKIIYPAIIFNFSNVKTIRSNNNLYNYMKSYEVTFVSTEPHHYMFDKLMNFPYSSFDRRYVADNLYHDVFTIFYTK